VAAIPRLVLRVAQTGQAVAALAIPSAMGSKATTASVFHPWRYGAIR
jgi:hypothetical protein